MRAKAVIDLLALALFVFLLLLFIRRRSLASEPAAHRETAIAVEDIRQRLEKAKANYKGKDPEAFNRAIDDFVASLRAKYGEQVPAADAIRLLRQLPLQAAETAPLAPVTGIDPQKTPEGLTFQWTPDGFLLRASCRSLVTGALWTGFAALLAWLPFVLWGGLIRGVRTDQGFSFWLTSAFLAAWACAFLYLGAMASVAFFGEIRISKTGDRCAVFTGIGKAGWTRHLQWSEFDRVGIVDVATSSGKSARTEHYVQLAGPSNRYKFGSELTPQQQAFIVEFLRQHVFHAAPAATQ